MLYQPFLEFALTINKRDTYNRRLRMYAKSYVIISWERIFFVTTTNVIFFLRK